MIPETRPCDLLGRRTSDRIKLVLFDKILRSLTIIRGLALALSSSYSHYSFTITSLYFSASAAGLWGMEQASVGSSLTEEGEGGQRASLLLPKENMKVFKKG
jgi:hypothetical protein